MELNLNGIIEYLVEMQDLCIEQTGRLMSVEDYIGHLESDEFRNKYGVIELEDLLDMLIHG